MPETYRSAHTGSIADLIGRRGMAGARALQAAGDAEAQRIQQSGQAWGNAIGNIAQGVSGTLADFAQQKADAPNRLFRQRQSDMLAKQLEAMDAAEAQAKIGQLAEMALSNPENTELSDTIAEAMSKLSPEYAQPLSAARRDPQAWGSLLQTLRAQAPGYKAPEHERPIEINGRLVSPKGEVLYESPAEPEKPVTVGGRLVRPSSGEVVYEPPPEPEKPTNPTEASLAMLAAQGNQQAAQALQKLRSLRAPQVDREPLIAVMGDDGQPVMLPRSQAVGRRPASNREQGRPVTSGDAGRLADLDTSLDDLAVLSETLQETSNATGTSAQIGASLPKAVTDLTGWGTDAKKRQGVIDRVKQVIGKALEGGVLRKEDELKYAKILPTIGDTPEVAASKLDGLQQALIQRRQTTIDALSDAGYDVSKFQQRTRQQPQSNDPVDALIRKYGGGE